MPVEHVTAPDPSRDRRCGVALRERDARFLAARADGAWFRGASTREQHAIGVLRDRGYLDRGADASWRVNDAGRAYLATRGRSFRRTTAALALPRRGAT